MLFALGILLAALAAIGTASSTVFVALALLGVRKFRRGTAAQRELELAVDQFPPASVLKPLHGLEPQLKENLESFFRQDYPAYEVILAVDEASDAALPLAREVCASHPETPSRIIVNGVPEWPNPPAWSYAAMARHAACDILVTSDSDVIVEPNYLREVVSPLLSPKTAMVTCLYRGLNTGGFWSALDAIGMSVEMTAGVLTANLLEGMKFGLGPTIAVRRDALEAIGGFEATGEYFSNDFILGNLIAAHGFEVVLSRHVIDHVVPPMTFKRMWRRQLRWAMGTKYSRPKGHFGTSLIFAMPFGICGFAGALLLGHAALALAFLGWAILNRLCESVTIGYAVTRDRECLRSAWLYPLRDIFGFALWVGSYLVRNSMWRRGNFELAPGGKVISRNELNRQAAATR